jgi:ABC-type amino acid transport substrate-binding protein
MMRALAFLRAAIVTWLAISPALATAQTPVLQRIVETGTLRIGMSGDQPPLNATSKSGDLIGLEVDLANFIADALEVEVQFVKRPFPELLSALKRGEVDIVMSGMTINAERSLDAVFVGPYMVSGKSILTTSGALAEARTAADIDRPDVTVAALRNSTSERFAQKHVPKAKLVTVENYDDAVQMILRGEIDALVADVPAVQFAILRHPGENLATLAGPFTVEPIGIAVPSTELPLQMLLDNYVTAYENSGLLEMLRVQWLEKGDWVSKLP